MEALEAIKTRKSIRKFLDREVPIEIIKVILEAGIRAPSGGNRQPWRFIAITDREKIQGFDPDHHQPWVEKAPAVIVACANPHDTWEKYGEDDLSYIIDTSAAIENMLLAIHGLGLGGVWILDFSKRAVRRILNIPDHWQIISIVPFGYYNDEAVAEHGDKIIKNAEVRPRKPMHEVAFLNGISNPIQK